MGADLKAGHCYLVEVGNVEVSKSVQVFCHTCVSVEQHWVYVLE